MPVAPTITFRGIRRSEDLEAVILSHFARLERYVSSLVAARILLEIPQKRHQTGNRCHVSIELSMPGKDVVVTHDTSLRSDLKARGVAKVQKSDETNRLHRHAAVAIRKAFEVARRRAQDQTRLRRGAVKTHWPSRARRAR